MTANTREERADINRKYLKENVNNHINTLVLDLLKHKPDNVQSFMCNWCQTRISDTDDNKFSIKPTNQGDYENQRQKSEPALDDASNDISIPVHPPKSTLNLEKKKKENRCLSPGEESCEDEENDFVKSMNNLSKSSKSDDDDDDDDEEVNEEEIKKKMNKAKGARGSVSAEAFGMFNKKCSYIPKIIAKTDEVKDKIRERLSQAFMFAMLDDKEKEIVINAMEETKFDKGDQVIKQGEDGEVLFMIDSGSLRCQKRFKIEDPEDTYLKTYIPGEAFGEQALLYNAPRAATIIAEEDSVLYSLDRDCFNSIVKESAIKRRERYEEFVNRIEVLQELDPYERGKLTDVFMTEKFKAGDYVVKIGENGDKIFFIEEGTAKATKMDDDTGEEDIVYEYKDNDYFGELALLKDQPRAANIIATSDLSLASVDRFAFKRLQGPLEKIQLRNEQKYTKYLEVKKAKSIAELGEAEKEKIEKQKEEEELEQNQEDSG